MTTEICVVTVLIEKRTEKQWICRRGGLTGVLSASRYVPPLIIQAGNVPAAAVFLGVRAGEGRFKVHFA